MNELIPYGRQCVDADDIAAVVDVLRSDFLTTGPAVDAFEHALADVVGAADAVACTNGTAALHLAVLSMDLGPGDAVIVPTVTFLATANAIRLAGADVVFADVDPDTGLMNAGHLAKALDTTDARRVRAVIPVHLAGQPAPMDEIAALCKKRSIAIIEDACHAIGSTYQTRQGETFRVGAAGHSDLACFSFHPVKTVTMGEGGAVTGANPALLQRVRILRNHGMTRNPDEFTEEALAFDSNGAVNPWHYEMTAPGLNYRASDIHCALGTSQLSKLPRFVARRRALAAAYDARLKDLAPLVRPLDRIHGANPAWHLYVVLIDFARAGRSRRAVIKALRAEGIATQVHYIPVHLQPYYRRLYGPQPLPGAMTYFARCLSLPIFPAMTDDDVERVVGTLARTLDA